MPRVPCGLGDEVTEHEADVDMGALLGPVRHATHGVETEGGGVLAVPPGRAVESVSELDVGEVLDESEEVGARRGERSADVVVRQAVELPQHRLAMGLQRLHQPRIVVRCRMGVGRRDSVAGPAR